MNSSRTGGKRQRQKTSKAVYSFADFKDWREIDPPIRLGVFGDPVEHSLSPQMQNAALRALEIKMQYARFHIRPNELQSALRFFRELDFVGVNLTVPPPNPGGPGNWTGVNSVRAMYGVISESVSRPRSG